jgi:hypothetical protein
MQRTERDVRGEDLRGVVLDARHAGHLHAELERNAENEAAEQVDERAVQLGLLARDGDEDLGVLSAHERVVEPLMARYSGDFRKTRMNSANGTAGRSWMSRGSRHCAWPPRPWYEPKPMKDAVNAAIPSMNC